MDRGGLMHAPVIVDNFGRVIAPPQSSHVERADGPWNQNRSPR